MPMRLARSPTPRPGLRATSCSTHICEPDRPQRSSTSRKYWRMEPKINLNCWSTSMVNKTVAGSVVFFIAIERQISCAAEGGKLYLLPIDLADLIGHFIFDEDSGACAPSFFHVRCDAGLAAMRPQA